jgi:hypothetical protein
VLASTLRPTSTALALAIPAGLALLATMCSSTPPAAAPLATATTPPDASVATWSVPDIPLARPRTVILLQPPPAGPEAGAIEPIAPDPAPLSEQKQWVYDLRYDKGEIYLTGVHPVALPEARPTPRMMGRFALELYSGPTLIERVRFDFPGLGAVDHALADGGRQPLHGASFSFTSKLSTRVGVMFPATVRGTKLELWDRATHRRWRLSWPAIEMTVDPSDSGAE